MSSKKIKAQELQASIERIKAAREVKPISYGHGWRPDDPVVHLIPKVEPSEDSEKLMKRADRERFVLQAFANGELHGMQIPSAIAHASNGRIKKSLPSLYPVLYDLEKRGLLESRWGQEFPEERGGARRRYYRLTDTGREAIK